MKINTILTLLIVTCLTLCNISFADDNLDSVQAIKINQPTSTPSDIKPIDIIKDANVLKNTWYTKPIPLSSYTEQEIKYQKLINEKTADAVATYSTKEQEKEWTKYDHDEITPYTWKILELDLTESNGKTFATTLLRPNWWIRNIGADKKGNRFYLKIPEVVEGWAVVKEIRINQLDTRLWDDARDGDYVFRPLTATFQHDSDNVLKVYFGDNQKPLEVTPEHPIYSVDKNKFVHAGSLSIGENVKTRQGLTTLTAKDKLAGTHRVYNLEVYRDHNYMVSMDSILVHNTKIEKDKFGNIISREPKSLQDSMALAAAKQGKGIIKIKNLDDPKYKGMVKMESEIISDGGVKSSVHYVKDPKTGKLYDFKFVKHSTDYINKYERISEYGIRE